MISDGLPPALECPAHQSVFATVDAARAARLQGDYHLARCTLDAVLALQPGSADAWVEAGFVDAALGDSVSARQSFLRALGIAPDYDDAKLGLAVLAYRAGDLNEAHAWLERISPARAEQEDVAEVRRAVVAAHESDVVWRLDAYATYSDLTNDLAPWRGAGFALSRRGEDIGVGLAFDYARRFGVEDAYAEVRLHRDIFLGAVGLAVGGAADAQFLPESSLRLEYASQRLGITSVEAGLTIARYPVGEVEKLMVRGRQQVASHVQLDGLGVVVRDERDHTRTGYGVGASWMVRDALQLDAAWVDAPESSEGATIEVHATSLGATFDLGGRTRVRIGVTREERESSSRTELALSLSQTF